MQATEAELSRETFTREAWGHFPCHLSMGTPASPVSMMFLRTRDSRQPPRRTLTKFHLWENKMRTL